ncbi:MAG: glycosyltransferase [Candidatus Marinimicrobia bacterium]|nr:glycosyltransferase [Candidatus Neomarinimicrobiota bacterium]
MKQNNHEVLLATPGKSLLVSEAEKLDMEIATFSLPALKETRYIKEGKNKFSILAALYDILALMSAGLSLFTLIRKSKPDIVYANQMLISISSGIASTLAGTPSIWHIRENPSKHVPGFIKKIYGLLAFLFADQIIVNSQYSANLFQDTLAREKVVVVPIGIQEDQASYSKKNRNNSSEIVIAVFGRVIPMKGHDVLIRSMEHLNNGDVSDIKLKLYGYFDPMDSYYLQLTSLIKKLGFGKKIEFCGYVTDISLALNDSSIVVSPSTESESFGRTITEAMAAGRPVIASRIGAHPEIVQDGTTGILVEPNDPQALGEALAKLIGDEELRGRMGRAGRERYLKAFTLEKYHQNLFDVYTNLLEGAESL